MRTVKAKSLSPGRQHCETVRGSPIRGEEQLDREFGGGHLERGVEGPETAEEGQLAAEL